MNSFALVCLIFMFALKNTYQYLFVNLLYINHLLFNKAALRGTPRNYI